MTARTYTIRRRVFTLVGSSFDITDGAGKPVGWCRQRAFRLREDLRIYTDAERSSELLRISARSLIDFGATYDVLLPSGESIGSVRRKGLSSILRDTWLAFDPEGRQAATLVEDSAGLAIVRRFLPLGNVLFPQAFHLAGADGRTLATYTQNFNLLVQKLTVRIEDDSGPLDELMLLAVGCLLGAIEGRQQD
jgi:hypothetical protein